MYFDLFIVKTPTMEHPNQGTVLKLRFYGNIHLACRENFASVLNKWSLSKNFYDYSTFNVHERCKTSNSLPIFIARSTSFMFDSMEELSITVADCSVQLKRWLLSLLAFIKLFLNYLKSSSDDVSNVLILDSFFLLQYMLYCHLHICNILIFKEVKKVALIYIEEYWTMKPGKYFLSWYFDRSTAFTL